MSTSNGFTGRTPQKREGIMSTLTPECKTMAKRLTTVNMVLLVVIVIAVVLMIIALVLNYQEPKDDTDKDKRTKQIGTLNIISLILVAGAAVIGVWHMMIAKKINECIGSEGSETKKE